MKRARSTHPDRFTAVRVMIMQSAGNPDGAATCADFKSQRWPTSRIQSLSVPDVCERFVFCADCSALQHGLGRQYEVGWFHRVQRCPLHSKLDGTTAGVIQLALGPWCAVRLLLERRRLPIWARMQVAKARLAFGLHRNITIYSTLHITAKKKLHMACCIRQSPGLTCTRTDMVPFSRLQQRTPAIFQHAYWPADPHVAAECMRGADVGCSGIRHT